MMDSVLACDVERLELLKVQMGFNTFPSSDRTTVSMNPTALPGAFPFQASTVLR